MIFIWLLWRSFFAFFKNFMMKDGKKEEQTKCVVYKKSNGEKITFENQKEMFDYLEENDGNDQYLILEEKDEHFDRQRYLQTEFDLNLKKHPFLLN